MSIYNINTEAFIKGLLPIDKRTPIHIAWLNDLSSGFTYLNQNLNEYIYGVSYSYFSASATYSIGTRVIGGIQNNNFVYQSITSSNHGNTVSNNNYWEQVNNNFIGVSERDLYIDQKMTFEWALNRWFNTRFVQNTGVTFSATHSDIYISDNAVSISSFIIGAREAGSSDVFNTYSSGFVINGLTYYPSSQYTINVPNAVLSSIPGTQSGVRNFADKYNYYGIQYSVVGY